MVRSSFFHLPFALLAAFLASLASAFKSNGDSLLLGVALFHEGADVFGNGFFRFTLFNWHWLVVAGGIVATQKKAPLAGGRVPDPLGS